MTQGQADAAKRRKWPLRIFSWRGRGCFISILVGIAVGVLLPLISASFAA